MDFKVVAGLGQLFTHYTLALVFPGPISKVLVALGKSSSYTSCCIWEGLALKGLLHIWELNAMPQLSFPQTAALGAIGHRVPRSTECQLFNLYCPASYSFYKPE